MPAPRLIACILTVLLLHPLGAQTAPRGVRDVVGDLPIGSRLTVTTLDGRELHGKLSAIDVDTFVVREVDLKASLTIRYDEVRKVSKNYGRKGFGGRRVSPRRSLIAGLFLLGGLIALVAVVATTRD